MVRELRLPVSMFLTDSVAGPGYGHFARLQSVGASIQNHTLGRATLRGLPYAGQRAQICGQQDKLRPASASGPGCSALPTAPTIRPHGGQPPTAASRHWSCGAPR